MLRTFFVGLSKRERPRILLEESAVGRALSRRFVAGNTLHEAIDVVRRLNASGIFATIDNLGEDVTSEHKARQKAELCHRIIDQIALLKLNCNLSLKLTQLGIRTSDNLAHTLLQNIVAHAASVGCFVRVDMEESEYTESTLRLVCAIHDQPECTNHIGAVIQAYFYRSYEDVEKLIRQGIRVRLCKGAYREPPSIAFPRKADVDANYARLFQRLLISGIYHGLATHDAGIIEQVKNFVQTHSLPRQSFEFQMLYGIRRDLQQQLVKEGWRLRVYVPFGPEWYPYFMRRLAERPANVLFLAKNLLRT